MKYNQVTIKDIARELGISPSTVSRALKDHPDISPETKKAVNELAEKLNYQPNIVALSLRQSKTNTIGVIIPEIVHFFFSTVISGIEDVAYSAGYNVIITQSNESLQREKTDIKALFNSRVDGMLISLSRETNSFEHIDATMAKGVPMVFFDRVYDSANSSKVIVDDLSGAKDATQHLIDQGCKRIAHLEGPPNLDITKQRLEGFREALKENNLPVYDDLIVSCPQGTIEEGKAAAEKLLKMANPPDAIFSTNDPAAMGAMQAIKEAGLKIPQDIAVVGFSNWFFSSLMDPPLTSVDQPGFEMGQEAAKLLIRQIEVKSKEHIDPTPETKLLKTRLVVRDSSLKSGKKK
ncbi:LacI family DNA-binding transcriptional regulator [Dawidia soli]|uniref:LacI family transcriptional regulator n=1 Tax=Dawidia soli TaxID=2782352 RepID=A0AAP2D8M3_9BACT|nr:LacI family DNA-binding transcriptional regulator [Dawidia soli]MBT1686972.1 LacI family transcriptional regulator [Dawidia soli]